MKLTKFKTKFKKDNDLRITGIGTGQDQSKDITYVLHFRNEDDGSITMNFTREEAERVSSSFRHFLDLNNPDQ